MKRKLRQLAIEPLTKRGFRPFGDLIEFGRRRPRTINDGFALRFHDLAHVNVAREEGRPTISLFRATRRPLPLTIGMLERHPLGSQSFFPLSDEDWLVVVAQGGSAPDLSTLRCFRARGEQGINFAPGTWHFPVLVLAAQQNFIVVDREGPGINLEEHRIKSGSEVVIDLPDAPTS